MELQFDNHDERIRYYELILERNLENLPFFPLPDGYRYVFFRPGDRDYWIDIEKSAKEFASCEQGGEAWNRYYGGREDELTGRMVFVEDANGGRLRLQLHSTISGGLISQATVGSTGLPCAGSIREEDLPSP